MKRASVVLGRLAIAMLAFAPGCGTPTRTPTPKSATIFLGSPARTAAASEAAAIQAATQALEVLLQGLAWSLKELQAVLAELKAVEARVNR